MDKKVVFYVAGGLVITVVALYLIKVKVASANTDSLVAKWLAKHPESRDSSGAGKVPLLIKLISNNKLVTYK